MSRRGAMVCGLPNGHTHKQVSSVCCIKISRTGQKKVMNRKKCPTRFLEGMETQKKNLGNSALAKYQVAFGVHCALEAHLLAFCCS